MSVFVTPVQVTARWFMMETYVMGYTNKPVVMATWGKGTNYRSMMDEQLKLGKPRSGSDPWRDSSSDSGIGLPKSPSSQENIENNRVNNGSGARTGSPSLSPKLIDLSQYLSQNSVSINNSGSNQSNTTEVDRVSSNGNQTKTLPASEEQSDTSTRYVTGKDWVNNSETLDNEVFSSDHRANKAEDLPFIIKVVDEDAEEDNPGDTSCQPRCISDESNVRSVLDQVKAKLRSRSEGLAAHEKARSSTLSTANSRPASLTQPAVTSDLKSPVSPQQVFFPSGKQVQDRRGSERYREIRDHILGSSISPSSSQEAPEHPQILHQQQQQQQRQQQHHEEQKKLQEPHITEQVDPIFKPQGDKRRLSKIPVPTWRRRKNLSKTPIDEQVNRDVHDLEPRQFSSRSCVETRHVSPSLAAKFSEFRDDLDKEEELLKHVTERKHSSLPNSNKDPLLSESPLVKFVVVGTSKPQEVNVIVDSSFGCIDDLSSGGVEDLYTDLKAEIYQWADETIDLPVSSTEPADQPLDKIAPPPLEFRDESSVQAETPASVSVLTPPEAYDNFHDGDVIVIPDTSNDLTTQEHDRITFDRPSEDKSGNSVDGNISFKKTSSIKRSRPVRKSATISYSTRDKGQLNSIDESQEGVSPVPRKRKSGFLVPRNQENRAEDNGMEPVENIVVPPPSDFTDSLSSHKPVDDYKDLTSANGCVNKRYNGSDTLNLRENIEEPSSTLNDPEESIGIVDRSQPEISEAETPQDKAGTTSSDSSEFWKRLIAEPTETPKATPSGRRPLRSSVPVFGNYPKASPTNAPESEQGPGASVTVKRRHSDVSNRPNMEQLFSSLLDDLDKASQSESNPSDMELSDGEDVLTHSTDSNTSGKRSDIAPGSTMSPVATEEITEPLINNLTDIINVKADIRKDPQCVTGNIVKANGNFSNKNEFSSINGCVTEDEIVPIRRSARNSVFQMPDEVDGKDLYTKEDSGIELGVEEAVRAKDVKRAWSQTNILSQTTNTEYPQLATSFTPRNNLYIA
ncbi:hypothetical protein ElyMa_001876800 [Elysia marginata]|uniref:Uncharacterized protein n=1 Tax=Elysia marginata TaxID=1093978 RepID=A0AAV4EQ98_9GAST|nr:hypothetical protein ElyMa_001876800 [Elysia marginata]